MTVSNGYVTLDLLKKHLGFDFRETNDDSRLEIAIEAASRQIDAHCGWRFWQDSTVQAREFYPEDNYALDLMCADPGDGISTSSGLIVKVDYDGAGTYGTTLTSGTDFLLQPRNAATMSPVWPYTSLTGISSASNYFPRSVYGRAPVQITAKWGWPAVPTAIQQACMIQAALLHEAKDAVFGAIALGDNAARSIRAALNPLAAALVAEFAKPAVG